MVHKYRISKVESESDNDSDTESDTSDGVEIRNTLSYLRPIMERMIEHTDCSEITITFKQTYRDNFDNEEITNMLKRYFMFVPLQDMKQLLLVPEYGNNSNLHFHGLIRGKKKDMSSLKLFLNKRFGRSTISMVRYPDSYIKYMLKEQDETTDLEDIIIQNNTEEEQ